MFLYERDPTTILLAKDHASERKESFYVKNEGKHICQFWGRPFEEVVVQEENDDDEEIGGLGISVYSYSSGFTYFESLTVYRNTRRAGCAKFRTAAFENSEPLFLLGPNGRIGAIPT